MLLNTFYQRPPRKETPIGTQTRPRQADRAEAARTHRIADGDTLAALAARYLGSSERLMEIYEANRDLLSDPDVLPIGVELRIPPPWHASSTAPTSRRPLVPVVRHQPE